MSDNLIECRGLSKFYGGVKALDEVDLKVGSGKIVGLLGPNAAGKTTLIKILNGLLSPGSGEALIDGAKPGVYTKSIVSYLPDKMYFADWMCVKDLLEFFGDFYGDFDMKKAEEMCKSLNISPKQKMKALSKGTKEKVQLILVMSRAAKLYLLDEPIAGVDPAARDYILDTILTNYNEDGTVLISTHLISDIEKVLDEAIFICNGKIMRHDTVDDIRETTGMSVDELFRAEFRAVPYQGGR
ncbi:MAG: ABC transporter ATP-binding protein [Bacillota bacterium]|nr:ABC transporter ATP-binding protein [Bacillota bacterium]